MNLIPDYTFFFQLALFLIILYALNALLIQPALRVLDKRRAATAGTREEIASLNSLSEKRMKEYEEKIVQAKHQGSVLKEKIKKQGEEEAAKILSKAKENSEKYLLELQARLAKEQSEARLQLRKSVEELGRKMAEEVLGKKVG
ncbi:MAG: ATP synthase F0 subunit B [bacterium]